MGLYNRNIIQNWAKTMKSKLNLEFIKKLLYLSKIQISMEKIRKNNSIRKKVALYDLNGNFIKEFLSLNECDDYLELYRGTTSKVFRGLVKTLRKKYIPKLI